MSPFPVWYFLECEDITCCALMRINIQYHDWSGWFLAFWVDLSLNALVAMLRHNLTHLYNWPPYSSSFSVIKKVGSCNGLRIPHSSTFPLAMNLLLLLLVLTNRQTQLVKADFSIALPLLVHSPYFSCWIPQLNTSKPSTGGFSQQSTLSDHNNK